MKLCLLVQILLSMQLHAQGFVYPVGNSHEMPSISFPNANGYEITRGYLDETGHTGVDLSNDTEGGEVRSIGPGIVTLTLGSAYSSGFGNVVMIRHELSDGTYYSLYAHLQDGSVLVSQGDIIESSGKPIGKVDCTGHTEGKSVCSSNGGHGPHLHFAIKTLNQLGCAYITPGSCRSGESFNDYRDPIKFVADHQTISSIFWQPTNGPDAGGGISSITIDSQGRIFVGTATANVWRSMDNGRTWEQKSNGITNNLISALATNASDFIFAGTHESGGIFRSTDHGESWNLVGLPGIFINHIATYSSMVVASDGHNCTGFYRSTDDGVSWTQVNSGINTCTNGLAVDTKGSTFAGSGVGGMYRLPYGGTTWEQINSGLLSLNVAQVVASVDTIFVGTATNIYTGVAGQGIFKSIDHGENWVQVTDGFTSNAVSDMAVNSIGHVFAMGYTAPSGGAATDPQVYRSTNGGRTWETINSGLPDPPSIGPLAVAPYGFIYTAAGPTGSTVYRSTQSTTAGFSKARAIVPQVERKPTAYELNQNFPNPFNPTTEISYTLPAESRVKLKVFNIFGQEVAMLVNSIQDAGYRAVTWNSSNTAGNQISSGVYFYCLEATRITDPAKSFVRTMKMIVLR